MVDANILDGDALALGRVCPSFSLSLLSFCSVSFQLEDISGFEEREEALAVEMAAAAAVAGRLEVLDRSFLLALDFMTQEADKQHDSKVKKKRK